MLFFNIKKLPMIGLPIKKFAQLVALLNFACLFHRQMKFCIKPKN